MDFYIELTIIIFLLAVVIRSTVSIQLNMNTGERTVGLDDVFLLLCFFIFYVLSAFRNVSVGRDTAFYSKVFRTLGSRGYFAHISRSIEGYRGYRLVCRIVYLLFGDNFLIFNCAICLLVIGMFFKLIKQYSNDYYMSVILLMLMYTVYNSWNISRQYCAISLGIGVVICLKEKKYVKSAILELLAISFHSTAVVLLVVFLIELVKWTKSRFIAFSIMIFAGTFSFDFLVNIFLRLFPRFSFLYAKQFSTGDFSSHFGGTASGRKSLISILFLVIILITLYYAQEYELEGLWSFMTMTMISIVIGIVFRHYSAILRIQEYFSVFCIISVPNMLEVIAHNRKNQLIMNICLTVIMIVPYYVQLSENYSGIIPYSFFVFK